MVLPFVRPVKIPAALIVAIPAALLLQAPPVAVSVSVIVAPGQRLPGPEMGLVAGRGLTVIT